MRRDTTQFRERFERWKNGEKVYEAGLPKYKDGKDSLVIDAGNLLKNNIRSTFDIPYGSYGTWETPSRYMTLKDVLGDGVRRMTKTIASNIAHNNGGNSSINPILLPFLIAGLGSRYYGFVKNKGTKDPFFSAKPDNGADVINLAVWGDDTGFKRYLGDTIKINGKPFGNYNNTYYSRFLDKDTLRLSPKIKDFIQLSIDKNANNFSLDHTSYLEYNKDQGVYTQPLYDAQHFTGLLFPEKMLLLDSHDGHKIYDRIIKTPYFVQEIPIKYLTQDTDDELLWHIIDRDKSNWHKDQREGEFIDFIKQHGH